MSEENGQPNTDERRNRIDRALAELTRGEGLTPSRVQNSAPWLIKEFGVPDAQAAHDLIRSTLEALDWSSQYELPGAVRGGQLLNKALLNAFGGEGHPKNVAERRKQHARMYGVTLSAIAAREKKARILLADTLARITGAQRQEPEG